MPIKKPLVLLANQVIAQFFAASKRQGAALGLAAQCRDSELLALGTACWISVARWSDAIASNSV
jgi:hypothetical protein